jgi:hypothetical protein
MRYIVKELAGGRYYPVRSFDTEEAAKAFAAWIGRKAKIVSVKSNNE